MSQSKQKLYLWCWKHNFSDCRVPFKPKTQGKPKSVYYLKSSGPNWSCIFFLTLRVGNLTGMQRAFRHTDLEEEWTWAARPLRIRMTRPLLAIKNTWPRLFLKDRSTGSAEISPLCRSGSHRLTAGSLLDRPLFRPERFCSIAMPICTYQDTHTHTHAQNIIITLLFFIHEKFRFIYKIRRI